MGKDKPRHADRGKTPPPNTVPDDYGCDCGCHDGAAVLCFAGCCVHSQELRVSVWLKKHPDQAKHYVSSL